MKRIVILGNSPAGVEAIAQIRQHDQESVITWVACDQPWPYHRETFVDLIAVQEMPLKKAFVADKAFFNTHRVDIINDQEVSRINFKLKKIYIKDQKPFSFDVLLLTDLPQDKRLLFKGHHKEGLYGLWRLKALESIRQQIPLVDTVMVQAHGFFGLALAIALLKRKKEVMFVTSASQILAPLLGTQMAGVLEKALIAQGLRIMAENNISEVLGDQQVKAVRLASGKVLATQMVVFEAMDVDFGIITECDVGQGPKILVNEHYQSVYPYVYVLDRLADQECYRCEAQEALSLTALKQQGSVVAAHINGQEAKASAAIAVRRLDFEGVNLTILGEVHQYVDVAEHDCFDEELGCYQKLYLKDNVIVGAVLLNAIHQEETVKVWIQEGRVVQDIERVITSSGDIEEEMLTEVSVKVFNDIPIDS